MKLPRFILALFFALTCAHPDPQLGGRGKIRRGGQNQDHPQQGKVAELCTAFTCEENRKFYACPKEEGKSCPTDGSVKPRRTPAENLTDECELGEEANQIFCLGCMNQDDEFVRDAEEAVLTGECSEGRYTKAEFNQCRLN